MSGLPSLRPWCTFSIDGGWYALPVDRVQEVLRPTAVTPVPLAPLAIRGLLQLRGTMVTVVDLGSLLGRPVSSATARPQLVVRDRDLAIGLLVDRVTEVQVIASEDVHAVPANVPPEMRAALVGVLPRPHGLLTLLDLDELISRAFDTSGGPDRRKANRDHA